MEKTPKSNENPIGGDASNSIYQAAATSVIISNMYYIFFGMDAYDSSDACSNIEDSSDACNNISFSVRPNSRALQNNYGGDASNTIQNGMFVGYAQMNKKGQPRRKPGNINRKRNGNRFSTNNRAGSIARPIRFDSCVIHRFVKKFLYRTQDIKGTLPEVDSRVYFSLSDLPNHTAYSGIYEQYRIAKIQYDWIPAPNVVSAYNDIFPAVVVETEVRSILDFDNASGVVSFGGNWSVHSTRIHKPHVRVFEPTITRNVYNGSSSTDAYEVAPAPWLDCAYDGVQHYGLRVKYPTTTHSFMINIWYTFWLEFRGPIS